MDVDLASGTGGFGGEPFGRAGIDGALVKRGGGNVEVIGGGVDANRRAEALLEDLDLGASGGPEGRGLGLRVVIFLVAVHF